MVEADLLWRRSILLIVLLGILFFVVGRWRGHPPLDEAKPAAAPVIEKQPINLTTRSFNAADPPSDMPPLVYGEAAECDTDFVSNAVVSGSSRRTDATHAIVTVTGIKVTLQLNVVIWLPLEATQHVTEHENGHRQISEYHYQTADQLAARIAATHMGEQVLVSGPDLRAEGDAALHRIGAEITEEYDKQLHAEATQLRFDAITDHARNDVSAADGVAQAIQETAGEAASSASDAATPAN